MPQSLTIAQAQNFLCGIIFGMNERMPEVSNDNGGESHQAFGNMQQMLQEMGRQERDNVEDGAANDGIDNNLNEKKPLRINTIEESDEGFNVNFLSRARVVAPGHEGVMVGGPHKETFATREEAEEAIAKDQELAKMLTELSALSKTFGTFCEIKTENDGEYHVTLPTMADSKGNRIGGVRVFESWDEARDYYLDFLERDEVLTRRPLLEIDASPGEKLVMSGLDAFNPRSAPTEKVHPITPFIQDVLIEKHKPGSFTYENTLNEQGWEKDLFQFADKYISKQKPEWLEELEVERMDSLTPKQAIELSMRVVTALTKYKMSDVGMSGGSTEADKGTALELLQGGQKNIDNPDWQGNGICRNFSDTVMAVFESLKASQSRYSRLRNTYCIDQSASEGKIYRPSLKPGRSVPYSRAGRIIKGHAWNAFFTVSAEGGVDTTIIDATWGRQNLETGQIENIDYTLERMEPLVVKQLVRVMSEESEESKVMLEKITKYYALLAKKELLSKRTDSTNYYMVNSFRTICDKKFVQEDLPFEYVKQVGLAYERIMTERVISPEEANGLWYLLKDKNLDNLKIIFSKYKYRGMLSMNNPKIDPEFKGFLKEINQEQRKAV